MTCIFDQLDKMKARDEAVIEEWYSKPPTRNQKRLRDKLMSVSDLDDWREAVKEFECGGDYIKEGSECACGHEINQVFEVIHKPSKTVFKIGNDCIEQFVGNRPLHMDLQHRHNIINRGGKMRFQKGKFAGKTFNSVYKANPLYHHPLIKLIKDGKFIDPQFHDYILYARYKAIKASAKMKKIYEQYRESDSSE